MNPSDRVKALEEILDILTGWKGKSLKLHESVSHSKSGSHDRHFATKTSFKMLLEGAGWAISGGKLMIYGQEDAIYEIAFDYVDNFKVSKDTIELVENLGGSVSRLSVIKLLT